MTDFFTNPELSNIIPPGTVPPPLPGADPFDNFTNGQVDFSKVNNFDDFFALADQLQAAGGPPILGGDQTLPPVDVGGVDALAPIDPIGNAAPGNVGAIPDIEVPGATSPLEPFGSGPPGGANAGVLPGVETDVNLDPLAAFGATNDNVFGEPPILPRIDTGVGNSPLDELAGNNPLNTEFFPGIDGSFQEQPLPGQSILDIQGDPGFRDVGPGAIIPGLDPLDPIGNQNPGAVGPIDPFAIGDQDTVPPEGQEGFDESLQFLREFFGLDEGLPGGPLEVLDNPDFTTGEGIPGGELAADEIEIARLDPIQPDIQDFSQLLQFPLFEEALGRLGAQNPFDARMQTLLDGPLAQIDQDFDEAHKNLVNRLAVTGKLDSPEARFEIERLTRDQALAKANVRSQFAAQAAGEETGLRRGAIQDLAGVLDQELNRVFTEAGFAERTEERADRGFETFFDQFIRGQLAPEQFRDEGLRLGIGGTGTSLTTGQAAAGAQGAAQGAGAAANARTQALFNALGF